MWIVILVIIIVINIILSIKKDEIKETKAFNNGICRKCNNPFRLVYVSPQKSIVEDFEPGFRAKDFNPYEYDKHFNEKYKKHIYECPKCKTFVSIKYSEADKDILESKKKETLMYEAKQVHVNLGMSEDVENYWN